MRQIMLLVTAAGIVLIGMAMTDFLTTGHIDVLPTSAAICAPLICAIGFRLACRPSARISKRK